MSAKCISWFTGVCLASLAALPNAALAQAPDGDEIIVTAQKREQSLQDVPLALQALTATDLENAGANKVSDLVNLIPGASIVSASTPGFETIQIRGISAGTTGDGLVGYYIDETPFGIPNLQLTPPSSLIDVERVEVLRGPSGTLYGGGAMGGNIKIVTKRPDASTYSGLLQGQYSNTSGGGDNQRIDGVVNVPIVENRLAVRVSGGYEELSGYADGPSGTDLNGFKGSNVRGTALWTPTDTIDVSAQAWHISNRQDFSNNLTPAPTLAGNPTISDNGGRRGFTDVDMDLYSLTANWDLGFATMTSNTSNFIHKLDFSQDILAILNNDSTFKTVTLTQELRLASNGEGPVNWIVGGFYRDGHIKSDINFRIVPATPIIFTYGDINTKAYAVFGELSWAMFDGKLEPLVGLRYSEDERTGSGRDIPTGVVAPRSAKWDSLNPRFNLKYNASEDVMFYFNAAKGFRSGSFQTQAQVNASNALGIPTQTGVEPDSVWTYEVGTRLEINDSLLVEASAYHSDYSDIILQFATAAVISLANGGDATIDGFDLGLTWRTPIEGLDLGFVGNINNAEFERVVPALGVALATVNVGKPLPNVPSSNFTVSADYQRALASFDGVIGSLYASYSQRGTQIDAASGLLAGELNDLTLRAGVEGDRWKLNLFALNALDDDDPAVRTGTAVQIMYPRRVGVELGFNF